MLIDFSISNYKSYKDLRSFNLVASTDNDQFEDNVATISVPYGNSRKEINLLKSAAIYGANASGKSNLLSGLKFMRDFVFNSSKDMQIKETIPTEPCIVSDISEKEPSHFEISFYFDNIFYRYGFDVTSENVISEWLFFAPKGREAKLFIRSEDVFDIGESFKEGKGLENKTRNNALFLSVCAQFNGKISISILNWFKRLNVISGIEDKRYLQFTLNKLEDEKNLHEIENFIKYADLGIDEIKFEQRDIEFSELPSDTQNQILNNKNIAKFLNINDENKKKVEIKTIENKFNFLHSKYDEKYVKTGSIPFRIDQESQGTQKMFAIAGPVIDTLKYGKTLFIDELDTRLHPLLTQFIIKLFNSKDSNKNNAQLIFATHDTNLLSNRFFRRDQIWFTEKNKYNITDLYSLSDFKIRKDATFNKDYIMGKYGAIPYITDSNLFYGNSCE